MYGSKVKGQRLTFVVSGQLWNGSLVMMDVETKSLWSHILGECVAGKLKGTQLEVLPSDTTTWETWLAAHPKTTVLNMRRTSNKFSPDFYRRPERFAFGIVVDGSPYHVTFPTLLKQPVQNLTLERTPLVLSFDRQSTSARLFSRTVDGKVLTFTATKTGMLKDRETGSLWNRSSGRAVQGTMQGKQLTHRAAILTFTHKWRIFHPKSKAVAQN